jgi:RimJ/RimL family protein N-acetyltransferase
VTGPAPDVRLRAVEEADLPILFEHQLHPEANRIGGFTPRDREAFMAHWSKILVDETVVARTVLVDGRVGGHVVSFTRDGVRQVGYWIGRELWGRGVATAALAALLNQVSIRPLHAYVARQNVASVRVLEKCGFTITSEGVGADGVEELMLTLPG